MLKGLLAAMLVICLPLAGMAAEKAPLRLAALGGKPQVQSKAPGVRTAQACNICRNGFFYCYIGSFGPPGTPCWCASGGTGWISCF